MRNGPSGIVALPKDGTRSSGLNDTAVCSHVQDFISTLMPDRAAEAAARSLCRRLEPVHLRQTTAQYVAQISAMPAGSSRDLI